MSGRLQGKVAVITGAAGGIGSAVARKYALEGAAVCCVDIDAEGAAEVAALLQREGGRAIWSAIDVASTGAGREIAELTVGELGGLDVYHANAAIQRMGRLEETTVADWGALFDANLRGIGLGIAAALPAMRDRGGGAVTITASLLGLVGDPDLPAYGAMKGGLVAMSKALAAAHGPENIRVNTICPADVETPMLNDFFAHQPDGEAARKRITANYPLRRFAMPEDVANVAAFLASDEASFLTGIDMVVDGGLLAQIY